MRILQTFAAFFLVLFFSVSAGFAVSMDGTVRICLSSLGNPAVLHLKVSGSYSIGETDGLALANGLSLVIKAENSQLELTVNGHVQAKGQTIVLRRHVTEGENGLRIQEAHYPSNLYPCDLELTAVEGGIRAIASVYIEDYLLGVLPFEMDNSFPLEALKAQAVAARSYVLRKMSLNSRLYDVVDTTADQVYFGTSSVQDRCLQAVLDTWGEVGFVDNQLMPGYYTASNGGQTETVKNAWGGSGYEFLPIMDDPYDLKNPLSEVRSVTFYKSGKTGSEALTRALNDAAAKAAGKENVNVKKILSVEAFEPRFAEPSRVYTKIRVKLLLGTGETVAAVLDYFETVEKAAGLSINVLNNEILTVSEEENGFVLSARRMGHGVGLSQRGAQQMANDGLSMIDILRFYYPGIELQKYELTQRMLGASAGNNNGNAVVNCDSRVVSVSSGNILDFMALRDTPSVSGKILKILSGGTQAVQLKQAGDWSMIQCGLSVGYIETAFLHEQVRQEETQSGQRMITAKLEDDSQALNVRAAPSVYSQILGSLRNGEKAEELSRYTDWSCIRIGTLTGYVRNQYLQEAASGSSSAVSETAENVLPGMQALVLPAEGTELYAEPEETSFVYLHLPQGTQLKVTGLESSGMIPVSLGGLAGYVDSAMLYLSLSETDSGTSEDTSAEKKTEEWAVVTASSGLKLRQEASTSGKTLLTMPYGEKVKILDSTGDGFWQIEDNGVTGYASSKYLSLTESVSNPADNALVTAQPTSAPTEVPPASGIIKSGSATITAENGVNLRSGPSGNDSAITVLGYGVKVKITGEEVDGYYPVSIGSLSGYVSSGYLKLSEETASQDQTVSSDTEWKGKRAMVTSRNGLNLRAEASSSSASYYVLPYGTVVEIENKTDNGFYLVSWSGYRGYVSSDYMQLLGE